MKKPIWRPVPLTLALACGLALGACSSTGQPAMATPTLRATAGATAPLPGALGLEPADLSAARGALSGALASTAAGSKAQAASAGPTAQPVEEPGQMPTTLSITGTVLHIALSARIIDLTEPVQGIQTIALVAETKIFSASGQEIDLRSIKPGAQVRAWGQPGAPGGLIASQIKVVVP